MSKIQNKLLKGKQNKQPGIEFIMSPLPEYETSNYLASNKLAGKIAIITGGDSGIGRAVAIAFAKEGAQIVITYFNEHKDAKITEKLIQERGSQCLMFSGNIADPKHCRYIIKETIKKFKKIDILVNNSAQQYPQKSLTDITQKQLIKTFEVNVFSYFYMTKEALPYLKRKSCIINTASITAYKGSEHLIDYSATKGAIVAFTRSLAENLMSKGIRVNGVAPGPIWTPLIPSSFSKEEIRKFGNDVPMHRPGQPKEIAPSYVFLASEDASYMSGQMLHPNGAMVING